MSTDDFILKLIAAQRDNARLRRELAEALTDAAVAAQQRDQWRALCHEQTTMLNDYRDELLSIRPSERRPC